MDTDEVWIDNEELANPKDKNILEKYIHPNKWAWDVFGNGDVIFAIPNDVSWSKRTFMRFLFKSKFKKL